MFFQSHTGCAEHTGFGLYLGVPRPILSGPDSGFVPFKIHTDPWIEDQTPAVLGNITTSNGRK